jgi:ABC-type sugar transport system ATPase subunit
MVNRPMSEVFPAREAPLGDVRLDVRGLASGQRFTGISFTVRAGEIVGLAGFEPAASCSSCAGSRAAISKRSC